jgi:hypothetical protein
VKTYIDNLSVIEDDCEILDSVIINSRIKAGSRIKHSVVIDSEIIYSSVYKSTCINSTINDSLFSHSSARDCYISEIIDMMRTVVDGDGKDCRVISGNRFDVYSRCFIIGTNFLSGCKGYLANFQNCTLTDCDVDNSYLVSVSCDRRIIDNDEIDDYELPIGKSVIVLDE